MPQSNSTKSASGSIQLAAHETEGSAESLATSGKPSAASAALEAGDTASVNGTKHPIDLETVLQLTSGQNPQVAFARERIHEAFAQFDRAQVLWLPSLRAGVTYDKHDGSTQQVDGNFINSSRTAMFTGFGGVLPGAATPAIPGLYANFQITDAIFQPRIAQRTAQARQSAATAATNDALMNSAVAYLELLRTLQDAAIAREALLNSEQLAEITRAYAEAGKGTQADHDRVSAEVALRKNDLQRSEESIQVAAVRLAQQLSVDPRIPLEPAEPTIVPIDLVPRDQPLAELVAQGLSNRPEVCEHRALVDEAVQRLKREECAPLVPSILLGIGYGGFGGGTGGSVAHFNNSFDSVVGAFWEVRNLGFGERAARDEARSRLQQAQWKEVAALDVVAREVVEAHTQVNARLGQIATAQEGVQLAGNSYQRNLERIKNVQGLPIETLQSIQALAQAQREYLRTLIAYNEAQFRLHRALGWPTEVVARRAS
jgi:outer membrane protein TolC